MTALAVTGAAAALGAAGAAGTLAARAICARTIRFADGPPAGRPSIVVLIAFACAAGVVEALHAAAWPELALAALLCCALAGIWYSDVRCGIVPDVFTLVPLALILIVAVAFAQWTTVAAAALTALPFAVAALTSRGRGMGWGDVKLVALGGAVLGLEAAVLAFGCACALAVVVALVRKRAHEPLAFAPYLVAAIALPLALGLPR